MPISSKVESSAKTLFLFSLFLYAFSLPISITLTNISLFLLLFSMAIFCILHKKFPKIPISFVILATFFLWATVTRAIASGQFEFSFLASFKKLWNMLGYILLPALAFFPQNKIYSILKVLIATASLVVILGMIELSFGIHYFFSGWFGFERFFEQNRFSGFQSHPLHTGGLYTLLFLFALAIGLFHTRYPSGEILDSENLKIRTKEKYLWIFCAVLLGLAVFLTGSRSYYLALIFAFFLLLARRGWKFFLQARLPPPLLFSFLLYSIPL